MYAAIGLHQPKTPENIGSVLRAADAFGASLVAISGKRYRRASTDTSAGYRKVPTIHTEDLSLVIPFNCIPVAVELTDDANDLCHYVHPKQAFYIFGPEDGSVPKTVLNWCVDTIKIRTRVCLNLAAAVNVVLYDRLAKSTERDGFAAAMQRFDTIAKEKCSVAETESDSRRSVLFVPRITGNGDQTQRT